MSIMSCSFEKCSKAELCDCWGVRFDKLFQCSIDLHICICPSVLLLSVLLLLQLYLSFTVVYDDEYDGDDDESSDDKSNDNEVHYDNDDDGDSGNVDDDDDDLYPIYQLEYSSSVNAIIIIYTFQRKTQI